MKIEDNTTYKQTREVLALARTLYRKLAGFYAARKESLTDERVTMLMTYMERHEQQMQEVLTETMSNVADQTLDTYYQFQPEDIAVLLDVEQWHIDPDIDIDEMIATVMRFDDILRDYYKRASQMTDNPQVLEVFENLMRLEEEKRNREARDALSLKDL